MPRSNYKDVLTYIARDTFEDERRLEAEGQRVAEAEDRRRNRIMRMMGGPNSPRYIAYLARMQRGIIRSVSQRLTQESPRCPDCGGTRHLYRNDYEGDFRDGD